LDDAARSRPDSLAVALGRGAIMNLQAKYADAAVVYRKVMQQQSDNGLALNNLAYLTAMHDKQAKEAVRLLESRPDVTNRNAILLDTLAVALGEDGQPEPALRHLERSLDLAPKGSTWFHIARAQLKAGNRGDALVAWNTAARLGYQPGDLHP